MPNNCSTLIHRKQNSLQKLLRTSSQDTFQKDITETTTKLCITGTLKAPNYSSPSTDRLIPTSATRRSNLFAANRIQPSPNQFHDKYLPTIRYTKGNGDRQNQMPDEFYSHSHSKTPSANTTPKSNPYTPSGSISSIFNALARRSTENLISINGGLDESIDRSPVPPPSRRSQRRSKANEINQNITKQSTVPKKQSTDSGIDIRFSNSLGDANQQHRILGASTRPRTNAPQVNLYMESSRVHETAAKERTNPGHHYQRRPNNASKVPIKQKIDKYLRRSEEAIQAVNGATMMNSAHNGLSGIVPSPLPRSKPPPLPSSAASRHVLSDAEIQARLDTLRVSINSNLNHLVEQPQIYSHQYPRNRVKSPYLYPNHQQISPVMLISNPQTPPVRSRRSHGPTQQTQRQHSSRPSTSFSQQNLYLAFIASRHLSTLEKTLLESDADRQKVIRIFTWLKDVDNHRHEQLDHDQLLIEQNQRMEDQDENLSLYSEIQCAVDDLPANTSGTEGERIVTMEFED